ncbi:MAG: glycosyltransferase [Cyclobacteriaceae bacterium]
MSTQLELSVVVCTFNRQRYLLKALEHLGDQTAGHASYEVIIVDNNSPDETELMCRQYIDCHPDLNIHYYKELQQGHSFARNRGIKESSGSYIAFIDDDAYVRSDYVANLISHFDEHPDTMALGGKILPIYETQEPAWMSTYLLPLVAALDMGEKPKPFKGTKYPIGANMAFRSECFVRHGLFDPDFGRKGDSLEGGDEKELFLRLKRHQETIYYVPTVVVDHIIPERRLQKEYIKGLGTGVGSTERRRVSKLSISAKLFKIWEEVYKMAGTIVLSLLYCLSLQFSKAKMLIRFRFWVWQGLFRG